MNIKDLRKVCQPKGCDWRYTRYVTVYVTRFLLNKNIVPNQVTLLWFILAILGSALIFSEEKNIILLGIGLVLVGQFFDHVDGELARAKSIFSPFGVFLDWVAGYSSYMIAIIAIILKYVALGSPTAILISVLVLSGYSLKELLALRDIMYFKSDAIDKLKGKSFVRKLYLFFRKILFIEYFFEALFIFVLIDKLFIFVVLFAFSYNLLWIGKVVYEFKKNIGSFRCKTKK
jgi:phosphatidylglycerophosphate synthase